MAARAPAKLPYAVGTVFLGAMFLERKTMVLLYGVTAVIAGMVVGRIYSDVRSV